MSERVTEVIHIQKFFVYASIAAVSRKQAVSLTLKERKSLNTPCLETIVTYGAFLKKGADQVAMLYGLIIWLETRPKDIQD